MEKRSGTELLRTETMVIMQCELMQYRGNGVDQMIVTAKVSLGQRGGMRRDGVVKTLRVVQQEGMLRKKERENRRH